MSIKYSLHSNKLKGNSGTYYAQVDYIATADIEDIVEHILKRGSSVSKSDILAVYNELQEAFCHFLREGYYVNTPLVKVYPSIKGKFESYTTRFHRDKHKIKPCVLPGTSLMSATKRISVEKTSPKIQRANFFSFTDINSGNVNGAITPGGIASLKGKNLKIDRSDNEQGIFFVSGTNKKYKVEHIAQNTSSELLFMVPPDLEQGQYKIEILHMVKNHKKSQSSQFHIGLFVK